MLNEELPLYDYEYVEGYSNACKFETKNEVDYLIRFKPNADYVSPEERWRDEFDEIIIEVTAAPDPMRIPADRAIFPTVAAIITHFFEGHQRVILYICDDSDSRELARRRKFDTWYIRLGTELYEKYDLPTVSVGPERYFASILFRRDNPNRLVIIDAFDRFATGDK